MSKTYRNVPQENTSRHYSSKEDKKVVHGIFRAKERNALRELMLDKDAIVEMPEHNHDVISVWPINKNQQHNSPPYPRKKAA